VERGVGDQSSHSVTLDAVLVEEDGAVFRPDRVPVAIGGCNFMRRAQHSDLILPLDCHAWIAMLAQFIGDERQVGVGVEQLADGAFDAAGTTRGSPAQKRETSTRCCSSWGP
jgi:hypothetical protein